METKELICIGCPMGCMLTAEMEGAEVVSVTGNTCPRGEAYAKKELTDPTRIVTSSVHVQGALHGDKMCNVRTASDVPKKAIFDVIRDIKDITVEAPVHIGQVVKANVAGTGVDVIAAREIL